MVLDIDSKAVQPTLRAAASTLRAARAAVIGGYRQLPAPAQALQYSTDVVCVQQAAYEQSIIHRKW